MRQRHPRRRERGPVLERAQPAQRHRRRTGGPGGTARKAIGVSPGRTGLFRENPQSGGGRPAGRRVDLPEYVPCTRSARPDFCIPACRVDEQTFDEPTRNEPTRHATGPTPGGAEPVNARRMQRVRGPGGPDRQYDGTGGGRGSRSPPHRLRRSIHFSSPRFVPSFSRLCPKGFDS